LSGNRRQTFGGRSGLEPSRSFSDVQDGTPIVFIIAHDDSEVRAQAIACGCAGIFLKTDSRAEVLAAIRRAIGLEDSDFAREPGDSNQPG
jgi:DNA-binding NarL/FixJ family response regulator